MNGAGSFKLMLEKSESLSRLYHATTERWRYGIILGPVDTAVGDILALRLTPDGFVLYDYVSHIDDTDPAGDAFASGELHCRVSEHLAVHLIEEHLIAVSGFREDPGPGWAAGDIVAAMREAFAAGYRSEIGAAEAEKRKTWPVVRHEATGASAAVRP